MAEEPETTTIQSEYAQRYTDHIAANRTEQAELTKRLEQLKADEAWLVRQLAAAMSAPDPATAETAVEDKPSDLVADAASAVPQPRQDTQAEPKAAVKKKAAPKGKAPAKRAAAKSTTTKKPLAKKASAKRPAATGTSAAAAKRTGPSLHELVLTALLKTPGEPRVAREVAEQLAQDHPDRATSIQTVRNNLESLVKKNAIEKSHQQGSAMYTAYPAGTPAAGGEAETAAEKVSVAV